MRVTTGRRRGEGMLHGCVTAWWLCVWEWWSGGAMLSQRSCETERAEERRRGGEACLCDALHVQ